MEEKARTFWCAANLCGGGVSFANIGVYACEQVCVHTYIDDKFSEIQGYEQIIHSLRQHRGLSNTSTASKRQVALAFSLVTRLYRKRAAILSLTIAQIHKCKCISSQILTFVNVSICEENSYASKDNNFLKINHFVFKMLSQNFVKQFHSSYTQHFLKIHWPIQIHPNLHIPTLVI